MFKKIKEAIKKAAEGPAPFDASRFGDELALQTEWTPCKPGGTNFKSHQLVEVRYDRMEFKASTGMVLFSSLFIAVGGLMILIPLIAGEDGGAIAFLSLMGLLFGGVGAWVLYSSTVPTVFDKTIGMFWKTRKTPDFYSHHADTKDQVRLNNIYAIQLIAEYIRGDKQGYYSYELNLVMNDGKRINVVDHGKKSVILKDAETLSRFLNKPVWNAAC